MVGDMGGAAAVVSAALGIAKMGLELVASLFLPCGANNLQYESGRRDSLDREYAWSEIIEIARHFHLANFSVAKCCEARRYHLRHEREKRRG